MLNAERDLGTALFRIDVNYRCSNPIISLANEVLHSAGKDYSMSGLDTPGSVHYGSFDTNMQPTDHTSCTEVTEL